MNLAALALLMGLTGSTGAPPLSEYQKLYASDGAPGDRFGWDVSISGDRVLVGAHEDDDHGTSSGAAYLFEGAGHCTWSQAQKLVAADGAANDWFGYSVSVSGDYALVGAYRDDNSRGSAYVFERQANGAWIQAQKLIANDGAALDFFGIRVSLSGGRALIGAGRDDDNGVDSGSAYIFERQAGGAWLQIQKLLASDGAANDILGTVSLSGDRALLGAFGKADHGVFSGAAYVFERQANGTWTQVHKLLASDAAADDHFGYSVSLSSDRAVVGAHFDDDAGNNSGAAYVFERQSDGSWIEAQKLVASDAAAQDQFGFSVSVSGDRVLVGAYRDDDAGNSSGSAYAFDRQSAGLWTQVQKLVPADSAAFDKFGFSVSSSGERALVGANRVGDHGFEAGAAYVLDVVPPPFQLHGLGCAGTGGVVPELSMSGCPSPGGQVQLDLMDGVGSGTAFLLLGLQPASIHMGFGCTLNVSPLLPAIIGPIPLLPVGAQGPGAGSFILGSTLPASVVPPFALSLQVIIADPGVVGGSCNTRGVEMHVE